MADVRDALQESESAVRSTVEEQLGGEDVSWDYEQVTGHVATTLVRRAPLADLVVTGRESQYGAGRLALQLGLLGDLLYRCRTPLFIPPPEGDAQPSALRPAVIAWDGSIEASNAVRASLEFLRAAPAVHLLHVERNKEEDAFPETRVLQYLSRHGIHAELRTIEAGLDDVATLIVGEALELKAGTIVMGGYNHSRVGELLLGGVTRSLLRDCPISLLMTH